MRRLNNRFSKPKPSCLFCRKQHKGGTPKLCLAKGEIVHQALLKHSDNPWIVFLSIELGKIDLDTLARNLIVWDSPTTPPDPEMKIPASKLLRKSKARKVFAKAKAGYAKARE